MNSKIIKFMLSSVGALMLSCFLLSFFSCTEEPIGRQPVDSDAPDPVSEVTWVPTPGGAIFYYKLPDNEDLLYVKATYSRDKSIESEARASIYADSLVIEGFGDTLKKEVSLYAVDRSGNVSTPEVIKDVIPLKPNIYSVGNSLELLTDFGGIRAKWINDSRDEVAIVVLRKDSVSGEYVTFEREYSTVLNGNLAIGNSAMPSVQGDYAIYAQDRWGHVTETKYYTLTPLFLAEFDKNLFREVSLPNDAYIVSGYPISRLWNNSRSSFTALAAGDGTMPKSITFDIGILAQIYRIHLLGYSSAGWELRGGEPSVFKIYGCAELDPTGSWDNWTELCDHHGVKPSGLPLGQNSAEDLAMYNAGNLFDIDQNLPKMRYIRIRVYETWGGSLAFELGEITIYGDNRE
jgi:hypothetical protein